MTVASLSRAGPPARAASISASRARAAASSCSSNASSLTSAIVEHPPELGDGTVHQHPRGGRRDAERGSDLGRRQLRREEEGDGRALTTGEGDEQAPTVREGVGPQQGGERAHAAGGQSGSARGGERGGKT